MIKSTELGEISESDGLVVMPIESIEHMALKLNKCLDDFFDEYEVIDCDLSQHEDYSIKRCYAVDDEGSTYPVVVIGAPDNFQRLLTKDEQNFLEFFEEHQNKVNVGQGNSFNEEVYTGIVNDFKNRILKRTLVN